MGRRGDGGGCLGSPAAAAVGGCVGGVRRRAQITGALGVSAQAPCIGLARFVTLNHPHSMARLNPTTRRSASGSALQWECASTTRQDCAWSGLGHAMERGGLKVTKHTSPIYEACVDTPGALHYLQR